MLSLPSTLHVLQATPSVKSKNTSFAVSDGKRIQCFCALPWSNRLPQPFRVAPHTCSKRDFRIESKFCVYLKTFVKRRNKADADHLC